MNTDILCLRKILAFRVERKFWLHRVTSSSLWCTGLEWAEQNVLGRLPVQTGTSKGCSHFGLQTQPNPTRVSCHFTGTQTQHTSIHPRKTHTHSHCLSIHPTSAWHTSKAPPGRLEERGPCEHGSLLAAFCLHSVKVLYCQDSVTHRPMPKPVSLYSRKSKNAPTAFPYMFGIMQKIYKQFIITVAN